MSLFKDRLEIGIQEAELNTQKTLSQFPTVLRWLFILCILAILPAYFIAKNVSHSVWLKRYQAGALTAKPSFTNPKIPTVSALSVTTLGQGVYSAVVQVSNDNLDLSADNIPYSFTFYNSQKQLVYSANGSLFLLPNQSKYIAVPRFTANDTITYGSFAFTGNINWQKKISIPQVSIITSAPNNYQQASPPAFVVEGDFTNQSPYTLKQVRLTFVLFDNSQKIIGVSQRDEFTVAPFERRSYKQLWPDVYAPNLASVKVFPDTNTLDSSNLIVQSATSNSSSDLSRPSNNQ